MIREVLIDDQKIKYTFTYKNVKNINVRIKYDGSINVSAPKHMDPIRVDKLLISKGEYILEHIKKLREKREKLEFEHEEKKYITGESFKYLGNDLYLKVIPSSRDEIYSDDKYIYLKITDKDNFNRKKSIVDKWFKEQTISIYNEIGKSIHKEFIKYGVEFPKIRIRKMKTRWGSCRYKLGIITMNSILIEAPLCCIEFVMMHEFCHFIYPNHSSEFYKLLETMMPNWKERKKILEERVHTY